MRLLAAVVAAAAIVAMAGCEPRRGDPPRSGEWDGTSFTQCDIPGGPPPGKVFGPRPGYIHILVVITADLYRRDPKGGRDICDPNIDIPFTIRLNGSLDGIAAIKLDRGRPTPWTERLVTPHFEHIYVPMTASGKIWEVTVHAVHEEIGVIDASIPRSYIRCAIFVDGNRAARHSARIRVALATASCQASGPVA